MTRVSTSKTLLLSLLSAAGLAMPPAGFALAPEAPDSGRPIAVAAGAHGSEKELYGAVHVDGNAPSKPLVKTWIHVSPHRCDFLVFTRSNQGFTGRFASADDVVLTATQGTVISTDKHLPVLHNGCVLLSCRKGSATIITKLASVQVPQGTEVLVDCVPSTYSVRVAVVGGAEVAATSRRGKRSVRLNAGEEFTFSERTPEADVQKFDRTKASTQEVARLIQPGAAQQVSGTPLRVLGADSTEFRCSAPDTINVRKGEIFAEVPEKLIVQTSVGDAVAAKGSVIDVDTDNDDAYMRIKAFSGPGHVAGIFGERSIEVSPGQELTAAPHELGAGELNPPDGVGRRRVELVEISDHVHGATADFSVVSFLNTCEHVQAIKHATTGDEKITLDKIIKTAAVVQTVTQKYGPYRAVERMPRKHTPSTPRRGSGSA